MRPPAEDLDPRRVEDHDELAGLFEDLVAEAGRANRSRIGAMWTGFRRALLLHLQAEELLLIPEYGLEHPDDAEALMEDHAFFRAALDDFEVNLEVRLRNEHQVRAFTNRLDAHARAEDEGLYAWARGRGVAPGR